MEGREKDVFAEETEVQVVFPAAVHLHLCVTIERKSGRRMSLSEHDTVVGGS